MTTKVQTTNAISGKVTITLPLVDRVECTINYRASKCAYEVKLWEDGISQYAEGMFMYKFLADAEAMAEYLLDQWFE